MHPRMTPSPQGEWISGRYIVYPSRWRPLHLVSSLWMWWSFRQSGRCFTFRGIRRFLLSNFLALKTVPDVRWFGELSTQCVWLHWQIRGYVSSFHTRRAVDKPVVGGGSEGRRDMCCVVWTWKACPAGNLTWSPPGSFFLRKVESVVPFPKF